VQIEAERSYAVLTGDVIGSSRLGDRARRRLHEALHFAGRNLRARFGEVVPYPLAVGDGEAFRRSGQALERLPRGARMGLALPADIEAQDLRVILDLIDIQARRWSDRQALAVAGALLGWTQTQIAQGLFEPPISQQAVAQHLSRAGWRAIWKAIAYFESRLEALKA